MRTIMTLLIGLSAVTTLSLPAAAEHFNDQSPVPGTRAPGVIQVPPSVAIAESNRFNDQGVDYIVASPTGSQSAPETVMAFNTHFNMR